MPEDDIVIRECTSEEDFKQCVALEQRIFKDDDIDVMPVRLYFISKASGGPTFGAFDKAGRLVAFGHTMAALIDKRIAYHSHLLGVIEELRDRDIGFRIKLAQRQHAIEAGVPLIVWTFDPLQSRNAHFNINKLGVIVRRYKINYYGENLSTVFDPDIPSDRVIAEWWVSSPHAKQVLDGKRPTVDPVTQSVAIPEDIDAIRARSIEEHHRWRFKVRDEFLRALEAGDIVCGFERGSKNSVGRYLFGPDEDQFHFSAYPA